MSGALFVGCSLLALFLIREPKKQQYTYIRNDESQNAQEQSQGFKEMFKGFYSCLQVPCIRWNLAGSFFRYGANTVGMGYGLFYFNQYNRANLFSVI